MTNSLPRLFLHGLGLALILGGFATSTLAAGNYEIEVIAFRYASTAATGEWSATDSKPDLRAARQLAPAAGGVATADVSSASDLPFVALDPSTYRLAGAEALLRRTAGYEVLAHAAWRQPGDAAQAVYLSDLPAAAAAEPAATPPVAQLEGVLRLQVAEPDIRINTDFVVLAGTTPVRVRAQRNVRSGELHYLDHELLGILLQVTALDAPTTPIDAVTPSAAAPAGPITD